VRLFLFSCVTAIHSAAIAFAQISVSDDAARQIGRRVWQNESGGSINGLTAWNSGEDFASLGIGHFIWYPRGKEGPFDESFPKLLGFMRERGVELPEWLSDTRYAPWNSRAQFMGEFNSPRTVELRKFLARTVPEQTQFLVQRIEQALQKMLTEADPGRREHVRRQFYRVASTPAGVYALIDYVNFKGEGVLPTERYKGQGWGLLQVLENMEGAGEPVQEFAESAKEMLTRRVKNSPPARNEGRWLAGWKKRIDTYDE
jgi:hypothetical protein